MLDVHKSVGGGDGPTVVWVHGGGFVSGRRSDLTNYAKVLAGQGFTVVNIDYTIAPEATYPEPVLANPGYARLAGIQPGARPEQLVGALLYCGVYDISDVGRDGGVLGWFVQSAGWAYSGQRNWRNDAQFRTMQISPHLTNAGRMALEKSAEWLRRLPQRLRVPAQLSAR